MASVLSPTGPVPKIQVYGDPLLHTDGEPIALRFAPDGSLWSMEEHGVLRHWNAQSGQQLGWWSLSDLETLWCFAGDVRILASASNDLTLWDVSSGQVLTAIAQESWVSALAFHPDPTFLATGHDDGLVRCWDVAGLQVLHTLRQHRKPISALAYSADGSRLAAASEDKTISLWDTKTGKLLGVLQGHSDRIPAVAWHPSGNSLVSAGWDTTARIWDIASLQPTILLNTHSGQVTSLAFSRDGKLLACADSSFSIHVWDFDARKTLHVLQGPQGEVQALDFSADGNTLAANGDRLIHLWDPRTGKSKTATAPRAGERTSVAVSPDGKALASNGGGNAARVWDAATNQVLLKLDAPETVHALVYSPDGKWIAGALGNHIRLWDAATGKVRGDWDGPEETITELAFSPECARLASASATGLAVWIWNVADGEPILIIPDALDGCTIEALAFHPDRKRLAVGGIDWLATGGSNGAIALWDIPGKFEEAACFDGATALAMHPAGKHLAFATLEQSIGLWDFASQQLIDEFLGHDAPVTALAYSPDGKVLASGSEDRTLRIWNEGGEEIAQIELDSQITSLTFSADGVFLYTGNANTTCSRLNIADLLPKKS